MFKFGKLIIHMVIIVFIFSVFISFGAEIKSQWRGPNRDGIYPEKNLLKKWPEAGPKMLWSAEGIGQGFSSAAVTSDRVYVTGMIDGTGYLFAFDHNGKQLWKKPYGAEWAKSYPGSRTTPTILDNRLYLVSALGHAICMDAEKGNIIWDVDMVQQFGAVILQWAITESVLIDGNNVICTPGGPKATMVALNKDNGNVVWICNGNGDKSSYCSPILIKRGNSRLIVTMTQQSIIGVNADTGKLLWSHPHKTDWDVNANTPIYSNGEIFCTSGYGTGSVKLKLSADGSKVTEIWRNNELDSQFGHTILLNGYLYGSGHNNKGWKCIDWNTGKTIYSSKDIIRKGNIIMADAMFYCYDESGIVALVKTNSEKFDIVSTFKVEKGSEAHWAHTVVKNGRLYVRHGDAMMVYAVK